MYACSPEGAAAIARQRGKGRASRHDDRRAVWREVAEVLGGEHAPGKRARDDSVRIPRDPWTIVLDTHVVSTGQSTVTYTRVRAYHLGRRELTVTVRRRNLLDRLAVLLGRGEGPAAARALTDRYVVRAQPASRLSSFLSGALVEAILSVPSLRLEVKRPSRKSRKRYGDGAGVVVCQATGVITEREWLIAMVGVVGEALESLARIGEATRQAPVGTP